MGTLGIRVVRKVEKYALFFSKIYASETKINLSQTSDVFLDDKRELWLENDSGWSTYVFRDYSGRVLIRSEGCLSYGSLCQLVFFRSYSKNVKVFFIALSERASTFSLRFHCETN